MPDQDGIKGEVIAASQDSSKNAYIVEYTLQPKDLEKRHLLTVFSLQPGRFLLTLTTQTSEDRWQQESDLFKQIVASYKLKLRD